MSSFYYNHSLEISKNLGYLVQNLRTSDVPARSTIPDDVTRRYYSHTNTSKPSKRIFFLDLAPNHVISPLQFSVSCLEITLIPSDTII